MDEPVNYKDFIKISQILNSITKIDVCLFDQDGNTLYHLIDHSIPAVIDQSENEYLYIYEHLNQNLPTRYYHYINTFGLEYIAVGVQRNQSVYGSILIGPFISSISVVDLIIDTISNNNLPVGDRKQLEEFYQSLPVLSETEGNHIGELVVNLCGHEYIHSQVIPSTILKPVININRQKMNVEENKQIIEERYQHQNKLMDAIAKGDKEEVDHFIHNKVDILVFSDRVPGSPIRSSKNMAIVSNTLYRVAAERSGVHPVYLHNISERFAILIERAATIPNLKKLLVLMANDYCDLVRTFSTGHFSPTVKKTVDYILLNLGQPLTLNQIANQILINPSHLSRKFKVETGMNITEFINQKRIEEAKIFLQRGNKSITDIAFLVGFNDLNYFSKVFKKFTTVTPSQYAKRGMN